MNQTVYLSSNVMMLNIIFSFADNLHIFEK